ncbi:ferrous iron transport protein B [uncultured Slackia sp.]|uniref:ferrous iron transport protein B n=1 Tax=uncultured Slackia sp. TaxID=665903 RepID=UPI0026DF3F36|nr:ferrous iron transport protein B [uncultured Slackia sp.]
MAGAMMTLDGIAQGQDAIIASVDCVEPSLRKHILDMGLTPGTEVTFVKCAPMGDPMEVRLRGYELTLRKEDAAHIKVRDVHAAHNLRRVNPAQRDTVHPGKGESKSFRPRAGERAKAADAPLTFALAGNQNCGKTTLFNQLTGSNQHVGNFPGVTVTRKDGTIRKHDEATVVDLPGIYSLSPYTGEEVVTREFLIGEAPDAIINIVDATNIERNLYLTLQLMELDIPMVLALNMMDEVTANGGTVDINALEAMLGIPVVPISAAKGEGIDELVDHALHVARYVERPGRQDFCRQDGSDGGALHRCIHGISELVEDHAVRAGVPVRFAATKLVEGDDLVREALRFDENEKRAIERIVSQMESEGGADRMAALADMRFRFIEAVCDATVVKPSESREHKRSVAIDRILTGRFTALPVFVAIMGVVFWLTFGVVGAALQEWMDVAVGWATDLVDAGLTAWGVNEVVHSLVIDGAFAGVGSVLSFLPIIVVLFFFLSLLEDSGYMARVAFVMDKLLRKLGLSGRSFVPMLIGFGCSVPAIMATRTLPSEHDRKMTVMLTPFMSCSAKLPIYALFTAVFFPDHAVIVMIALYVMGMVVGVLVALVLKRTAFKGDPVPFVMELPNYRMPSLGNMGRLVWDKAKDFLTRAFTIIFLASVVIWFLQTFDLRLNVTADSADSLLAMLGGLIAPAFAPLGFGDWQASTALVTGFVAKESVVSTLTVLLGSASAITSLFTPLTAFVFLTFALLYTPCVAAIAAVKNELGVKSAVAVVAMQCGVAWAAAFIVKMVGALLGLA